MNKNIAEFTLFLGNFLYILNNYFTTAAVFRQNFARNAEKIVKFILNP